MAANDSPVGLVLSSDVAEGLPDLLKAHVYLPSQDGVNTNLLVLLHGMGDTQIPFAKLGRQFALPQTAVLALRGPISLPFNLGFSWWPAFCADGTAIPTGVQSVCCGACEKEIPGGKKCSRCKAVLYCGAECQRADWGRHKAECRKWHAGRRQATAGQLKTRAAILDLFARIVHSADYTWDWHNIFLFGFSQGGSTALDAAMLAPSRLGGVVSIAGAPLLHTQQSLAVHIAAAGGGAGAPETAAAQAPLGMGVRTPVLLTVGDADPQKAALEARVQQLAEVMADVDPEAAIEGGISIHVVPGKGHAMIQSKEESRAVFAFLADTMPRVIKGLEGALEVGKDVTIVSSEPVSE